MERSQNSPKLPPFAPDHPRFMYLSETIEYRTVGGVVTRMEEAGDTVHSFRPFTPEELEEVRAERRAAKSDEVDSEVTTAA